MATIPSPQAPASSSTEAPVTYDAGAGFDRLMALLTAWLVGGLFLDGWASQLRPGWINRSSRHGTPFFTRASRRLRWRCWRWLRELVSLDGRGARRFPLAMARL